MISSSNVTDKGLVLFFEVISTLTNLNNLSLNFSKQVISYWEIKVIRCYNLTNESISSLIKSLQSLSNLKKLSLCFKK